LELSQPNAALRGGGKPVPDARCPVARAADQQRRPLATTQSALKAIS